MLNLLKEIRKGSSIKAEDEALEKEYRSFLSAKEIVVAYDSISETPEKLAEARIQFVRTLFTMSSARFKQVSQTLPDSGKLLNEKHRQILKELIDTHARNNNSNASRAERIFLNADEMTAYYRKKYNDFIRERKKEIEMNNQRSQVQFMLLKYTHLGMDECLDMTAAETFEVKMTRGIEYLKNNHAIELQPFQFRDNLQSYGANLINFYDLMSSAGKSVTGYYPPEYQKEFEVFFREHETLIFPNPLVARSIAAVKIVAAYQGKKIETKHPDYENMCKEIEGCLEDIALETCLAYIKKKDEPAETFFKDALGAIYDIIKEYHDNTVRYSFDAIKLAGVQKSLAQSVGKHNFSCPEKPSSEKNALHVVKNPLWQREDALALAKIRQKLNTSPMCDKPAMQAPVTKVPSLSSIDEQKHKPLPQLPKSYSASDVGTITSTPVIKPGTDFERPPSLAGTEKPSGNPARPHFFNAREMVERAAAKKPSPPIPPLEGIGKG